MKKILVLVLISTMVASVYLGCKKGPDDPFISFKSRKTRMVGTWKCSAYTVDGIDSLNYTIASTATGTPPCGIISASISLGRAFTLILGDDGNYSLTIYKDSTWAVSYQNPSASVACQTATGGFNGRVDTVETGIWEFAGGVGQYNNKELLELIENTDETVGENLEIVECSSNQMQLTETKTYPAIAAIPSKITPGIDSIPGSPASSHVYAWTYKH